MGLVIYLRLRRMGISNAWSLAGMPAFTMAAFKCIAVVVAAVVVWRISDQPVEVKVDQRDEEIAELRKIVAACVGDKFGTLKIGDEWYICGINPIGSMK